ncbi:MAG: nucleotidyltransferase domain-containing protein [Nitrospirae bacterium]|nr:nucleotidyltransferase domain-containing protein [Nitrospirota bacterium]
MTNVREITSELCGRLEELYGESLVHTILFGSHARGDAEPDSDIDILVVLQGERAVDLYLAQKDQKKALDNIRPLNAAQRRP